MKIVLCHGTFDLLHIGHMRMFETAESLGDRLIVTLTADKYVNKGPGRPIYNEEERAYAIRRLRGVAQVEIAYEKTGLGMIHKHQPAFYVKGGDYRTADKHGSLEMEKAVVESYGGKLVLLDGPQWSSSAIIERVAKWREAQAA